MPRIADALERESLAVDLEHGDFERLLDRRERKQRNRRIRAGAVGIIVALATAAALAHYDRRRSAIPATPPKPVGAGEVLTVGESLLAQDPDSRQLRTIFDTAIASSAATGSSPGAAWSSDRRVGRVPAR